MISQSAHSAVSSPTAGAARRPLIQCGICAPARRSALALRSCDVRDPGAGFSRRSRAVPHGVVHRINGDADPGDLCHPDVGSAWSSRINGVLVASSLGALAVACPIALSRVRRVFGFVAVPALLLLTIGIIVTVTFALLR